MAVDEKGLGRSCDSEVVIRAVNGGPDRIGTLDIGFIGTRGTIGVLYVDPHELCFAGSTLRRCRESRRLLTARYAPGGPEVDHQGRAFQRSKTDHIAVEGPDREVGDLTSNKRGGLLLRCVEQTPSEGGEERANRETANQPGRENSTGH